MIHPLDGVSIEMRSSAASPGEEPSYLVTVTRRVQGKRRSASSRVLWSGLRYVGDGFSSMHLTHALDRAVTVAANRLFEKLGER